MHKSSLKNLESDGHLCKESILICSAMRIVIDVSEFKDGIGAYPIINAKRDLVSIETESIGAWLAKAVIAHDEFKVFQFNVIAKFDC